MSEGIVGILLRTESGKLKRRLTKASYNFTQVLGSEEPISLDCDLIGFDDVKVFASKLGELKCCPLLWCNPVVVNQISYNIKVKYLDANVSDKGYITFKPVMMRDITKLVETRFSFPYTVDYNSDRSVKFRVQSRFDDALFDFLETVPVVSHKPFIVSLVYAIEANDFSIVDKFVYNNRLVTNLNKEEYKRFNVLLSYLNKEHCIQFYIRGKKIKGIKSDPILKTDLERVKFLVENFGTSILTLEEFLDHESTLSPY